MAQVLAEARPLIHFDQEIGQVNQGQTHRKVILQARHTGGTFLRLKGGHDDPSFVHPHGAHRAIVGQEAIHTREQLRQLASPLLQAYRPVFGRMELLTDLWTERGPTGFGNQVGFRISIASAARDPDIPRAQRPPQFPQGTELIIMPVNALRRVDHIGAPLQGHEVGRGLRGDRAPVSPVKLLEQRHGLKQGIRTLGGMEGERLQKRGGTLAEIAIPRFKKIKIAIVQGADNTIGLLRGLTEGRRGNALVDGRSEGRICNGRI